MYGYTVLVGAGVGCYVVAGFAVTQAMVKAEDVSNAVAFQSIGTISVALCLNSTDPLMQPRSSDALFFSR